MSPRPLEPEDELDENELEAVTGGDTPLVVLAVGAVGYAGYEARKFAADLND